MKWPLTVSDSHQEAISARTGSKGDSEPDLSGFGRWVNRRFYLTYFPNRSSSFVIGRRFLAAYKCREKPLKRRPEHNPENSSQTDEIGGPSIANLREGD